MSKGSLYKKIKPPLVVEHVFHGQGLFASRLMLHFKLQRYHMVECMSVLLSKRHNTILWIRPWSIAMLFRNKMTLSYVFHFKIYFSFP